MKSDLVDIMVFKWRETEKAVLVGEDDEDIKRAVWLPKSQIEIERRPDGFHTVTLPESLAHEKGLI
jgi:hypothetical protein